MVSCGGRRDSANSFAFRLCLWKKNTAYSRRSRKRLLTPQTQNKTGYPDRVWGYRVQLCSWKKNCVLSKGNKLDKVKAARWPPPPLLFPARLPNSGLTSCSLLKSRRHDNSSVKSYSWRGNFTVYLWYLDVRHPQPLPPLPPPLPQLKDEVDISPLLCEIYDGKWFN